MPESPVHILHLEDDQHDCELVEAMLNGEGIACRIECVQTGEAFRESLENSRPDLIISDYSMPAYDGRRALKLARETHATVPFIFFSGTLGEEAAVVSLKDGATDYVLKERPGRLVTSVRRALAEAEERRRRQLAEEKLREHAALLDEARDAICLQDLDQRILFWNKSAERLYGWNAAEALGKDANDLLIQDEVALTACKELIGRGEWHGELHQVTRAGRPLVVESRWTLIRDGSGQPKSILVINTDISEKKEMEAQYLRAQRVESIGMLAGGIAHDLNNILGPILMSAELLLENTGTDFRTLLQGIATSAQRGTDLVRQILAFARGAGGDKVFLDLRTVVEEATGLFASTFPRNIVIANRVPAGLPRFLGNATQIHQIILNLCVNARDAMPSGGSVTIDAAPVVLENRQTSLQREPLSGSFIELRIADTGMGIPTEVLPKILDPFFTTKASGKGTGLGLATVVGIMRGHGGSLDVATELGRGTTFTLYFPSPPVSPRESEPAAPDATLQGAGQCILCVDDEPVVLETTRAVLVLGGYRVLAARSAAEALELFQQHQHEVALAITDMVMPVMDGAQLIVALRGMAPQLPIIAVSGSFSSVKLSELPGTSVDAMLHKPFNAAALLSAVRRLVVA